MAFEIQITATFTAEPIRPILAFWLDRLGVPAAIRFSEFNQVLQQALNPMSESARNEAGFNLFLIRPEDIAGAKSPTAMVDEITDALAVLAVRSRATQVVIFCPHPDRNAKTGEREAAAVARLRALANVEAVTSAEWMALYPVEGAFDAEAEMAGRIPFSEPMYAALGTVTARKISARLRPPVKVIVLDADNTLWGGVCGEDGAGQVRLDGPWRAMGEFMVARHDAGMLLCLCSKNQSADVERVFAERSAEMALKRSHFAGWKVNWEPKSANIRGLAADLNLGLDSFVFLDDNPAEIAEVAANCPGVLALRLPADPDEISAFLGHLWPLDSAGETKEDASRTAFYRQESERRQLLRAAPSYADFLRGLELKVEIAEAIGDDLERVSQLTKRTNQFNANPVRLSEGELARRIEGGATCLTVRVADRFGDYGLVGAAVYHGAAGGRSLQVEWFMLSCRAMGKGVERAMLIELGRRARMLRLESIEFSHLHTDRNEPLRRFFTEIGANWDAPAGRFQLGADAAEELNPIPSGSVAEWVTDSGERSSQENRAAVFDVDLASRIAGEWRDPMRVLAVCNEARRPRPEIAQAMVKPGTALQEALAAKWREILGVEEVGVEDPFSALGGSSIHLVRLHAALRRDFDAAFELAELFELPTIAAQAARLERDRAGRPAEAVSAVVQKTLNPDDDAVAIVGLALRVPGANDPDTFWKNLAGGVESITRFTKDEIEYPEEFDKPGYVPAKGLMYGIDQFDAGFFGMLPKDARIMDPQQRIFLELAWEAMERAGYSPDQHRERIGVWAGAYFDTYLLANLCTDQAFLADLIPSIQVGSLQTELGNDKDYLATRVAFKMNLRGPAMTVQTACSTSMVAIVEACRAIRSGLCDMALAGGVTVTLPLKRGYFYTQEGMLSGDGHCRTFDEKASGTVFGNGAGVVMLKRLSDAIRDRDHIHAVIRGTGMNNDGGVKHSYTAPSVEGQVDVIHMAHRDAGVDPATIGYIEAHGTATPLGDPIEVTALTKAFRAGGAVDNGFCAIGSLKSNIGHLDVASGVCGVIKTALSLERELLPPLLHFEKPNPKIDFERSPFRVNVVPTPWTAGRLGSPRRAGVSSFGVGGTNAHVVLEEAPKVETSESTRPNQLFLLSARSEEALASAAANLAAFAENPGPVKAADAAWTLATGRKHFRFRRAVAAGDFGKLAGALQTGTGVSGSSDRANPPVHFLFPGQGAQHVNMGRVFYDGEPRFRRLIDACAEILRPHLGLSLTDILYPTGGADLEAAAERLKHTVLAQPAIFVIEYALADLWRHWGVEPAAMIGHSVGEFVAACHAGVFDLESGLRLLAARGRLMGDLPGGGMLSVRLSEDDLLQRLPKTLDLAAVNGPALCVVAGPHKELREFAAALEADGVVAQTLHTSHAFHSRMMDPVIDSFAVEFEGIKLSAPQIPILSTVTGEWLTEKDTTDPRYWAKHLREPVRFHRSVASAGEKPGQIFIEVGPGQTLTGLARQSLDRKAGHIAVSSCRHVKEPGCDHANMLESLGRLWTAGVEVNWANFYSEEQRGRVPLPTYPFERKRHWVDPKPLNGALPNFATAPEFSANPVPLIPTQVPAMSTPQTTSRLEPLAEAIRAVLTDLSGIPTDELAGGASFLELGFDSLLLTQVSKALQNEFQTPITLRQLMGALSSIDTMAAHLDATLPSEKYRPAVVVAPAPVSASAPAPVAAVSATQAPVPAGMNVATSAPVSAPSGFMESMIAQQLDLMRQQLAMLQGGGAVQAPFSASVPVSAPVVAVKSDQTGSGLRSNPVPSETPTVSAPTTAINRSLDDTLTDRQQRHLNALIAKYVAKTRGSKGLTAKYRQWHADPRTVSGFNRRWKEMIYQIAVVKSKGSRLVDVDGNEYIDLLNGFGPNFLGHSPDFVTEALKAQLDRGVEVGPQCVNAMEAAQLFCEVTGNERASFVNTGSEAVQAAMRLSRTVTGRDKIVVFARDYHGNFDEVLVKGIGSGEQLRSLPIAPGIPRRAVEDVIVLPYGTDEALDVIRSRARELAAVIVEPIQSRRPEFQPREFIQEVRRITRESGSVFVFDEVITGFRTGPRGAQEFYGVDADIATYGKVVGGGMPLGVVAGKAEYMDTFDGGMWQYGDDSFPEKGVTFFAGTFVRHPLAMAAVKQVLLHLKGKGPEFWQGVRERANRLAGTVDKMFVETGAPLRMPNFGSQMFVRAAEDSKFANLLFFHLRNKGVFLLEGFPTYMTAAHTDEDIDYVISAFRESVAELQDGGFFETPAGAAAPHLNGSRLQGPPRLLTAVQPVAEPAGDDGVESKKNEPYREPVIPLHPLTESLAEVWLASQVSENASLCFNEVNTLSLRGVLDQEALEAALRDVIDRRDALRSVFPADGSGFKVLPRVEFELGFADLSDLGADERDHAFKVVLDGERGMPFDLENGPLFRATLVRVAPEDHTLVLNAHHLACDGWSYNVLLRDLGECYRNRVAGRAPALEPAPRFTEFAGAIGETDFGTDEAYWMEQFAEVAPPLQWPLDFSGSQEIDYRCHSVSGRIDADLVRALKRVAGQSGATLFGLTMAAFQILLSRIARQRRFVVGFPFAGQNSEGHEEIVGHCVNFLPFVAEIDPAVSFGEFLKKTQQRLLDAQDHRSCTYGRLIKKLGPDRRPVVEAVFNLERMESSVDMPGLETEVRELDRHYATNPIFLKTYDTPDGLEFRLDYHSSRFTEETARQWLDTYQAILEAIAGHAASPVARIAAAISADQRKLLDEWNRTATTYPRDKTLSELFEETSARRGTATAIRFCGAETSYAELADLSDRIAHSLSEAGVAAGDRIGVFLERCPEMIAAMLAVLKLGAAYVPLDPAYPAERIRYMLQDSGATRVLTEKEMFDRLPKEVTAMSVDQSAKRGRASRAPRTRTADPEAAACLLYTSGSTGQPKGAVITHRGIVRLVKNTNYAGFGEDEVFLQAATFCFDACLFDTYGALLNGGCLVLPRPGHLTIDEIATAFQSDKVTQLFLTSGLFQVMVDERLEAFSGLRRVLTGGDIASPAHCARFMEAHPGIELINVYGPTENVTYTTTHVVTPGDLAFPSIPIGRPVANTTVWILDEQGNPVPPGLPGELYTGGDGVALGYLDRPDLTAERFLPDPFSAVPGARMYRTGDICRHRADGVVEFIGRIDHQVKIRGYRIEPGEIETQLGRHPGVRQCKVVVRGGDAANKFLVAYVAPVPLEAPTRVGLEDFLRSKLPAHMIPATFVMLDELPMNANGKVDTHALPEPGQIKTGAASGTEWTLPNDTEIALAGIWSDVLNLGAVGLDDDFFAIGGHSLIGMKLFSRIQSTFGVSLPLGKLFRAPTVRQLARVIEAAQASPASESVTVTKQRGGIHLVSEAGEDADSPLAPTTVAIQPKGDEPAVFAVHGGDGGILFYGSLAERLGENRPFFAFEAPALTTGGPIPEESVEETAAKYLRELRKVRPAGPYRLCGYSFGGVVAYAMAVQLEKEGEEIALLGLFDTENPAAEIRKLNMAERVAANWNDRSRVEAGVFEKMGALGKRVGAGLAFRLYFEAEDAMARALPVSKSAGWLRQVQLRKAHERAMNAYAPPVYRGRLTLFRALSGNDKFAVGDDYGWGSVVLGGVEIIDVPGTHTSLFDKENIEGVALAFGRALEQTASVS